MVKHMVDCHDMKVGEVYSCPKCGLEMKVLQDCDCGDQEGACGCGTECGFECCGEAMVKK